MNERVKMDLKSRMIWPPYETISEEAMWISLPEVKDMQNVYFRARKMFHMVRPVEEIVLSIAAESLYQLWVNGHFIGEGPVRGTSDRNFYDVWEVSNLLKQGDNWIAVLVQCMNIPTFSHAPFMPAVLIQAGEDITTGADWEVQLADEWRRDVEIYCLQRGFMTWQDNRLEPAGWQIGMDKTKWRQAKEIAPAYAFGGKKLLPRDIPPLHLASYSPVNYPMAARVPPPVNLQDIHVAQLLSEEPHLPYPRSEKFLSELRLLNDQNVIITADNDDGVAFVVDFGRVIVKGYEIKLDAPAGTVLDIACEEEMKNGRLIPDVAGYQFADRFILREGEQTIRAMPGRGFRMLQLVMRNFHRPIILKGIRGNDHRYPVKNLAQFECDDPSLNRIWTMCGETISACATDTFIDCPWRESSFWVNDMVVENQTWLNTWYEPLLNKRCMKLALSQRREDGLIPGVCPTDGRSGFVLVATNLFLPIFLEDYLLYTGDEEPLLEHIDTALSILDVFYKMKDEDGLLLAPPEYWNFIDWSYGLNGIDLNGKKTSVLSWFYVISLDTSARLLKHLGRSEEARRLEGIAESYASLIDTHFWVTDKKRYAEWIDETGLSNLSSQLVHALAFLSGRISDDRKKEIMKGMNDPDCLVPELYLHFFLMKAMGMAGQSTEILGRIRKYWGPIEASGSPTIWETGVYQPGKVSFSNAGSLCHGFATAPAYFFHTIILGIKPVTPGFLLFDISPSPSGLKWAKGTVHTPGGNITVSWVAGGGGVDLDITIPSGLTGRLSTGQRLASGDHSLRIDT
jgi:hypothetical protein